jgi:hypothetical protein
MKTPSASPPPIPTVSFVPTVLPQGDGSFVVKAGKPLMGRQKLLIRDAAKRCGLSTSTLWRLYDCGLIEGERPSPRKTFIYLDSLEAHLKASADQEYWDKPERREQYLKSVRGE